MPFKMVDMRRSTEEKADAVASWSPAAVSDYPYGLSICLTQDELEKLDGNHEDMEIGDIFDIRAMARVTSISENDSEAGKTCRVELQIVMMAVENEDDEAAEPISRLNQKRRKPRLYKD